MCLRLQPSDEKDKMSLDWCAALSIKAVRTMFVTHLRSPAHRNRTELHRIMPVDKYQSTETSISECLRWLYNGEQQEKGSSWSKAITKDFIISSQQGLFVFYRPSAWCRTIHRPSTTSFSFLKQSSGDVGFRRHVWAQDVSEVLCCRCITHRLNVKPTFWTFTKKEKECKWGAFPSSGQCSVLVWAVGGVDGSNMAATWLQ